MFSAPEPTAPAVADHARPSPRFLLRHPAHAIALGFGTGLSPVAPGTVGSLFGWGLFVALDAALPAWRDPIVEFAALAVAFAVGLWACAKTGRDLGDADCGAIVWDEIVAVGLVLAVVPHQFAWQAAGVLLFRAFDIVKPPPIDAFERRHADAFGTMGDDVIAAFFALVSLALVHACIGAVR